MHIPLKMYSESIFDDFCIFLYRVGQVYFLFFYSSNDTISDSKRPIQIFKVHKWYQLKIPLLGMKINISKI